MACFLGSKDLYKKCLLYDDLMANTEKETTELFEALGQIFLWNWLDHLALSTQLYKPCYEAFQMFWRHVLKTKHLGSLLLWLIWVETRSVGRKIRLPVNFIEKMCLRYSIGVYSRSLESFGYPFSKENVWQKNNWNWKCWKRRLEGSGWNFWWSWYSYQNINVSQWFIWNNSLSVFRLFKE